MTTSGKKTISYRKAGYAALIEAYNIETIPNWHRSLVATGGPHKTILSDQFIEEIYPPRYWPGDKLLDHLEFALKYDGTNLAILHGLFQRIPSDKIKNFVSSKPTGKYTRRVWFLYEWLTGEILDLPDLKQGNYVDLLNPARYYTIAQTRRISRQRINYNLAGNKSFCPCVRRTKTLAEFESKDLGAKCKKIVSEYPKQLLNRALSYLYAKETKSSFEIEQIHTSSSRTERFMALLRLAERDDFCEKEKLIDLQNRIVDPRFAESDYRKDQNYVGESIPGQQERVHFVSPRPDDLPQLMAGMIQANKLMNESDLSPVLHAAIIAYGLVFLHPFSDGNGRIHRFLIHNILARRGITPPGLMFPVSAAMLNDMPTYDLSLESFSNPLLSLVDYSLDHEGRMTVRNQTSVWYRFLDLTVQAESLHRFIERTVDIELTNELLFLANYDRAKKAMQEILDLPDKLIDLFIKLCLQNNGKLSANKRASHFHMLTDSEIERLQRIILSTYFPQE